MSSSRKYALVFLGTLILVVVALSFFFLEDKEERLEDRAARVGRSDPPSRKIELSESLGPTTISNDLSPVHSAKNKAGRVVHEQDSSYRIIGRVIDSKGKGISRVQLKFIKSVAPAIDRDEKDEPGKLGADDFELIRSGDDGRFLYRKSAKPEFEVLEVKGSLNHCIRLLPISEFEENERLLDLGDIQLRDGVVIRGRVLDPMGIGIAGAKVDWSMQGVKMREYAFKLKFEKSIDMSELTGGPVQAKHIATPQIVSDELGGFVVGHLEPGNYDVSASLKNYRSTKQKTVMLFEESEAEVGLQLRRLVSLQISVRDRQGHPVEGAVVVSQDLRCCIEN
ncbi:MAG: carboxypeptidase-like regulatory domain-containing protein [Planctomycetota bacterium]|nr:carboxypeptidase-like regulatory domain-containing protein [Planctomycetota bacterium]